MRNNLKKTIIEKGQGLTEYVLILAFIAGIAFVMFGDSASLKGTVVKTFTKAVDTIAGLFDENYGYVTASQNYLTYFSQWRDLKSDSLSGISNEERLKADQEGLALIASQFLSLDQNQVQALMAGPDGYSNVYNKNITWMNQNLTNYQDLDGDGWSDVLVPLSYRVTDYDNEGYLWFEASKNSNLVKDMTGEDTYKAPGNRTALGSRMFYSDGMIGSDSTDRAIAVKVHYATEGENAGKVDKVWIAAQSGVKQQEVNTDNLSNNRGRLSPGASAIAGESKSVDGLELMVTGSSSDYKYKIN